MAFKETLQLVIQGDNRGAVKAVREVGQVSSTEFNKSQKSIDKWGAGLKTAGRGMAAFGGAALIGLGGLAKMSEEANLSTVKLQNTLDNMPKLAGENAKQFTDLAKEIQGYSAADADAIVEAEAMLGTFNLTAQQIKQITPLVVDFSRKFGVDMVTAATMVGKALDGNVGALKRNGVSIDETMFKTDRYGAVQKALSDQVGGFARAEGATFAGSLERMKNQLGDLAEGVGGGAVDAFTDLFGAVGSAAEALEKISPGAQHAAGKIATFGAVGLVAVGGLSSLIGVAIQARTNFTLLANGLAGIPARLTGLVVPATAVEGAFAGATVATTGFAAALGTLSAATGVVAALFALRQIMKSFRDDTPDPEAIAAVSKELENLADTGEDTGDALETMFDKLAHPGDIEGTSKAIDIVDKGLAKLAATDPKAAGAAFDHIISKLHEMTGESEKTLRGSDMWDDYNLAVSATAGIQGQATDAVKDTAGALDTETDAAKAAADAIKAKTDAELAAIDPLFALQDALTGNADAQGDLQAKQMEAVAAQGAYNAAVAKFGPKSKEATDAYLEMVSAQDAVVDANRGAVRSAADVERATSDLRAEIEQNPAALDTAKAKLKQWQAQGLITAEQAKKTAREFDDLAGAIRHTPSAKTIRVTAHGTEGAKTKIIQVRNALNELHNKTLTIGVTTALGAQAAQIMSSKMFAGQFAEGGVVPGPRGAPKVAIVHGGEKILSLEDQAKMTMRTHNFPTSMAGTAAGGGGGGQVNVNVNILGEGLMRYLRNQVRVEYGGDVQAALGTPRR